MTRCFDIILSRSPTHESRYCPAVFRVRCSGAIHHIALYQLPGRNRVDLVLCDHPKWKRETLLYEFGSRCWCLDVLWSWRNKNEDRIPDGMLTAYKTTRLRRPSPYREVVPFGGLNALKHRFLRRTKDCLYAIFLRLRYRTPVESLLTAQYVSQPALANISARVRYENKDYGRRGVWSKVRDATYTFHVHNSWLRTVYRAGLAVWKRQLVLAVLEDGRLVVVNQSLGYSLTTLVVRPR